jgi:oxygen-dependent protoporphyrinogen oxidase
MSLLMNAAEPDEIHLGTLGTNVSMALDDYDQLRDGMAPLLDQFAASCATRLGTTVTGLDVRDGRVCGLRWLGPDGGAHHTDHDDVVLALPASASARLLAPHHPALARELEAVRYFPTLVVVAEYDRDIFRPDVRALRFDDGPVSNARAYATDALHRVRYTFSGRDARPLLVDPIDPEALLDEAEARLGVHFPVAGARRMRWTAPPRALSLCAYSQHHAARLERIAALVPELVGLHLTGDYLRGASIEACFHAAHDCVSAFTVAPAVGAPRRDRAVS